MTTTQCRVMVTGVNGDAGQGLVKALRLSPDVLDIHGCDASAPGVGAAFVRSFSRVPAASEGPAYVDALERACRRAGVDAVVPGPPAEIDVLCRLGDPPRLPSGLPVVCLPAAYRGVYDDKLECYRRLAGHVPLAPFADGRDPEAVERVVKEAGFPVVVKTRRGRGGASFGVVSDAGALRAAAARTPEPLVQGYIDDAGGEYTAGVFGWEGGIAAIAFRRTLGRTGSSWYAESTDDPDILDYAREVARASGLSGSANVQMRRSSHGPRLLEINARFSSLVHARAYAGFRDVEWSLARALGRTPRVRSTYRRIRFQRFVHEMIDEGGGYAPVREWTPWFAAEDAPAEKA